MKSSQDHTLCELAEDADQQGGGASGLSSELNLCQIKLPLSS